MSKVGVGVGDEFPVEDSGQRHHASASNERGQDSQPQRAACGEGSQRSESDDRCEFERWKWRREGERSGQDDVRNERAAWEAKKRAFKEKIRAAVHDAVGNDETQPSHAGSHSRGRGFWPMGALGISIAVLALAMHRHRHSHRHSGCRTYDSDIETPPRSPRPSSSRAGDEGPIVTPPPPREH
ncbi:MAG TPA: hypothetical protein VHW69_10415 [Rhizomicrobium sp.]|jgi:hypothetical protein|nr:hypothetical protein [Rhizomicrobium sp.]